MDEVWKKKFGLDQKVEEAPRPNLYGNVKIAQNREQDLRNQMFGGDEEPANRAPLNTHQASAKKQEIEEEEGEDDGQFIMKMLAERRKK